jgi:hypothetical protein
MTNIPSNYPINEIQDPFEGIDTKLNISGIQTNPEDAPQGTPSIQSRVESAMKYYYGSKLDIENEPMRYVPTPIPQIQTAPKPRAEQSKPGIGTYIGKFLVGSAAGILTLGIAYVNIAKLSVYDVYNTATGREKTLENLTKKTENGTTITFPKNNYRSLDAIYNLDEKNYSQLTQKILKHEETEGKMNEDNLYKMLRELDKNHDMKIDEKEITYPASNQQR